MISARGLWREFAGRVAVEDVSFEVPAGRVLALLGPNGAGKTTTVRMLLGLLRPTRGTAEVAGVALPCPGRLGKVAVPGPGAPGWSTSGVLRARRGRSRAPAPRCVRSPRLVRSRPPPRRPAAGREPLVARRRTPGGPH